MRFPLLGVLLAILISGPASGAEPDTRHARLKLIDEYFTYVPMTKMMDEMTAEVAKQIPEANRKQFIDALTKNFRMDVLEAAARESMARHLTLAELALFVEFIKRPEARSAMDKMKYYMADLMPVIQQEMARAFQLTKPQK